MKIFVLVFFSLFVVACERSEKVPEPEPMQDETPEETQEILVFDDIVGKVDELNHGERDIFFLYLNMVENQAFQISIPIATEILEKQEQEAREQKALEGEGNDAPSDENPAEMDSENDDSQKNEENIDEEEDSDEPDHFWVYMYAKQLVRDNWPTIFKNIQSGFPNIDFTGFEEYSPEDWENYRKWFVEQYGPDAINDLSPEDKKLHKERYERLYPKEG